MERRPFVSGDMPREPEYLSPMWLRRACEAAGLVTWIDRQGDYWFGYRGLPVGVFPMHEPHRISLMAFLLATVSAQDAADMCPDLERRVALGTVSTTGSRPGKPTYFSFDHDFLLPEGRLLPEADVPAVVRRFVDGIFGAMDDVGHPVRIPPMPFRRVADIVRSS